MDVWTIENTKNGSNTSDKRLEGTRKDQDNGVGEEREGGWKYTDKNDDVPIKVLLFI